MRVPTRRWNHRAQWRTAGSFCSCLSHPWHNCFMLCALTKFDQSLMGLLTGPNLVTLLRSVESYTHLQTCTRTWECQGDLRHARQFAIQQQVLQQNKVMIHKAFTEQTPVAIRPPCWPQDSNRD